MSPANHVTVKMQDKGPRLPFPLLTRKRRHSCVGNKNVVIVRVKVKREKENEK